MGVIRLNFNTEYASKLRDAVNDRRKQSVDNTHEEKGIKGEYYAWNRTCAAMDRLEDTIAYLNCLELGKNIDSRSAFDFYDFINNASVVIDCIKTLGRIFRIEDKLFEEIEKSTSIFCRDSEKPFTDQKFFEYIRSLCSVHPLCTNHQREFLINSKFHCCPYVVWKGSFAFTGRYKADLEAWIYTSEKNGGYMILPLYISQFENYLVKWINLIPKIIEAKNNFTDKEYEKLKKETIKDECYFSNEIQYLEYLKQEYINRFDYGDEYIFDQFIRVFATKISDKRNEKLLSKYQHAIMYSVRFLKNELQNMSYEGFENTGIKYPNPRLETTLFYTLSNLDLYDGIFSEYAYNIGKLYYLEEGYYNRAEKDYVRRLLEDPKDLINQYVIFSNRESDSETIVLVNLALYLESLTRNSLLNRNIPNDLKFRVNLLSEKEMQDLFDEKEEEKVSTISLEELRKLIDEYGG